MSTYNVRLNYTGDGELTFHLTKLGELQIYAGRDMYIKNATKEMIEQLRQYRQIGLQHSMSADIKGCYSVIDADTAENRGSISSYKMGQMLKLYDANKRNSVSSLKADLLKDNNFIPVEEAGNKPVKEMNDDIEKKNEEEKEKSLLKTEQEVDEINKVDGESEEVDEEPKKLELPEELKNYVAVTGKEKGKKFEELELRDFKKIAKYSTNIVEKANALKAIEILDNTVQK